VDRRACIQHHSPETTGTHLTGRLMVMQIFDLHSLIM
jgi:hypothetical protein